MSSVPDISLDQKYASLRFQLSSGDGGPRL